MSAQTSTDSSAAERVAARTGKQQLRAFVERIQRLREEKRAIEDDIKDVFAEAKGNGFNKKALQEVLKKLDQETTARLEHEAIVDTYMVALGMAGASKPDDDDPPRGGGNGRNGNQHGTGGAGGPPSGKPSQGAQVQAPTNPGANSASPQRTIADAGQTGTASANAARPADQFAPADPAADKGAGLISTHEPPASNPQLTVNGPVSPAGGHPTHAAAGALPSAESCRPWRTPIVTEVNEHGLPLFLIARRAQPPPEARPP